MPTFYNAVAEPIPPEDEMVPRPHFTLDDKLEFVAITHVFLYAISGFYVGVLSEGFNILLLAPIFGIVAWAFVVLYFRVSFLHRGIIIVLFAAVNTLMLFTVAAYSTMCWASLWTLMPEYDARWAALLILIAADIWCAVEIAITGLLLQRAFCGSSGEDTPLDDLEASETL